MTIDALIDKQDNSEILGDQIAAILVVESAAQQVLASAASKDPRLWKLRVFTDRANPWSEFETSPDQIDATPIINIALEKSTFDPADGNVIERQRAVNTYNIDCYGYGISKDVPSGGHIAGDRVAADEASRAARLVRNILMSDQYVYLGLRGTVARRWLHSVQYLQMPPETAPNAEHVQVARMVFEVIANEFSPQMTPQILDLVSVTVLRGETGELFFNADYSE